MASTQIILRNSGIASNVPTASNLELGELALNYTDGKLFFKNGSGDVITSTLTPVPTPATAGSTGIPGQFSYDTQYFYMCIATDTWKRVLISTW